MDAFLFPDAGVVLWVAGLIGAGLTAFYTSRMVILTFFGKMKLKPEHIKSKAFSIPLVVLAILSIIAGYIEMSPFHLFSKFMAFSLPAFNQPDGGLFEFILPVISGLVVLVGIFSGWYFYVRKPKFTYAIKQSTIGGFFYNLWFNGWAFDKIYDVIFVRPYIFLTSNNKKDFIDSFYNGLASLVSRLNEWVILTQTGRLRWYLAFITGGVILGIYIIVFL